MKKRKEITAVLQIPQVGNKTLPLEFWARKGKRQRARREDRGMGDPLGPPGSPLLYGVIPSPAGTKVKRKAPRGGWEHPGSRPLGARGGRSPIPGDPRAAGIGKRSKREAKSGSVFTM